MNISALIDDYFAARRPRMDELTKVLDETESAALLARELRDGTIRLEDVQAGDLLAVFEVMGCDAEDFRDSIAAALSKEDDDWSIFDYQCEIDDAGWLVLDETVIDNLRDGVHLHAMDSEFYEEMNDEGLDAYFAPYCDVLIDGRMERIGHAGLEQYLGELAKTAIITPEGKIAYTATGSFRADRSQDECWNPTAAAALLDAVTASGRLAPDETIVDMGRRGTILQSPGYGYGATFPAVSEWVCGMCGKHLRLPVMADIGGRNRFRLHKQPEQFRFPEERVQTILNRECVCFCPDCAGHVPMECTGVQPER